MNIDDMTHFPVLYLIFREKGMKTVFTCSSRQWKHQNNERNEVSKS